MVRWGALIAALFLAACNNTAVESQSSASSPTKLSDIEIRKALIGIWRKDPELPGKEITRTDIRPDGLAIGTAYADKACGLVSKRVFMKWSVKDGWLTQSAGPDAPAPFANAVWKVEILELDRNRMVQRFGVNYVPTAWARAPSCS